MLTLFEGKISAKSKYKPVNQGFEKYWKSSGGLASRTSYDIDPRALRSDTGTTFGHGGPREVLETETALAMELIDLKIV